MQFEYLAYDLLIERIINRIKTFFIYWLLKVPIRERLWKNFHLVYAFMNNFHRKHDAFLDMYFLGIGSD
jgi:hypothetical protein